MLWHLVEVNLVKIREVGALTKCNRTCIFLSFPMQLNNCIEVLCRSTAKFPWRVPVLLTKWTRFVQLFVNHFYSVVSDTMKSYYWNVLLGVWPK